MLNDGGRQGDKNAGEEVRETLGDAEALFSKLKQWIKGDYNSEGQVKWRREAREDFDLEADEQLNDEETAETASALMRVPITCQ